MRYLSALTFLPADENPGAHNEFKPHLQEASRELVASLKIIMSRVGREATSYAMVFDHQHCFHKIWGLHMSKWGMDFSVFPKQHRRVVLTIEKLQREYTHWRISGHKKDQGEQRCRASESGYGLQWQPWPEKKKVSYLPWRGTWKCS